MDPSAVPIERQAAILQAAITVALALLFGLLYRRYRRPHFLWWSAAWLLYTIRVGFIITFLVVESRAWLYLHQVATGWTALAILAAAFAFEYRPPAGRTVLVAAAIPLVWSWVTIFVLDHFLLAASMTAALLAGSTLWTGLVFLRFRRRTGSVSAGFVAGTLMLWGLHHLDYPILRAQGLLAPWSYYIDILLILALGLGVLLLVMEELHRGLRTLSDLSGDLQRRADPGIAPALLLERAFGLAGITGGALWVPEPEPGGTITHAIGAASGWRGGGPRGALADALQAARRTSRPVLLPAGQVEVSGHVVPVPFAGLVPVMREDSARAVAILSGPARAPFTALDEDFLLALGQQIGAALESAELDRRLKDRTAELERLSVRLIRQDEEQRRRLARELHDETAQVFSAMKLQAGLLAESVDADQHGRVAALRSLIETGMESIRRVADDLRPPVLDDLGLAAAMHALASDFREQSSIPTRFEMPDRLPPLDDEAELALFRALQEALANVARHAHARSVRISLAEQPGSLALVVEDDGRGFDPGDSANGGRMGLVGMQERLGVLGGRLLLESAPGRGVRLVARVPLASAQSA